MNFELLICVVKDDEAVEELLTAFLELGLGGATVVQGRGMAEIISEQLPLFAGFRDVFKAGGTSRLVISAVPEAMAGHACEVFEALRQDHAGLGVAFSVPISRTVGMHQQEAELLED